MSEATTIRYVSDAIGKIAERMAADLGRERIGCLFCGKQVTHPSGKGRSRKYCGDRCAQLPRNLIRRQP